ncbi:uncharacterized protein CMU_039400 [Cryptosporidium muris RN66]|uniref:tRNA (adenine(58)-N(1))-methyltransferase non-catalytic subunit TRM6 n=1 Tax=Cryptosporidium muris (strain RN66) TaxID=441375 RepID=B6A9I2_CRYMR|nr:uncharacterized protein CMU_039400 [Cryptosporidium muris RN66]EEA04873.1 hypothetical protein, conserved [Cryptosporidium muris RN66]|eukprot:XP_002139222.1 hypothetical protein [Cryptosporidium muris RN66]
MNNEYKVYLNSYVVLRQVSGFQKLIQVLSPTDLYRVGKLSIRGSDILGKPYYTTLSLEGDNWVIGTSLNSGELLDEILRGYDKNEMSNETPPTKCACLNPLINNNEQCNKVEVMTDRDRITTIAKSSSSFQNKTRFSQEKYIKKMQLRHTKQLILIPPTLMDITETASCQPANKLDKLVPNTLGPRWSQNTVRIETVGNILTHSNVSCGKRVILFDNLSGGIVGGSIYRQLANTGSLYEISMNQLTFDTIEGYNSSKLPLYFEAITKYSKPKEHYYSIPFSVLEQYYKYRLNLNLEIKDNFEHKWVEIKEVEHRKENDNRDEILKKRQQRVRNRLNLLNDLYLYGVDAVVLVVDYIKLFGSIKGTEKQIKQKIQTEKFFSETISEDDKPIQEDKNNSSNSKYNILTSLVKVSQKYLKPGGQIVLFTPHITTELLQLHQDLILSSRDNSGEFHCFVGVKMEETFIREHQILSQRSHPAMDANLAIFSGILLSAIHVL